MMLQMWMMSKTLMSLRGQCSEIRYPRHCHCGGDDGDALSLAHCLRLLIPLMDLFAGRSPVLQGKDLSTHLLLSMSPKD